MVKGNVRSVGVFAVLVCALFMLSEMNAATLFQVSDLIGTSAPNATTTHRIRFTTNQAIPASGSIVITPTSGSLTIPVGLDYTDVDFAVASGGPYVDRIVAASATGVEDGVSVVSGASGSITITLNSTTGIGAGEQVEVEVGSNATFDVIGDQFIQNASSSGSYRIQITTRDPSLTTIDGAQAIVVMIESVSVNVNTPNIPPGRFNGLPAGEIAAPNGEVEISLETDEIATCRYSTTPGVPYASMTNQMTAVTSQLFFANIFGLNNDTVYTFYVRCADFYDLENDDDYEITFNLAADPINNTSVEQAGSSGFGGVGPFTPGSKFLYLASVTLSGYASPLGTITLLKDGVQIGTTQVTPSGTFSITAADLERGTYTFFTYVTDRAGVRSAGITSTLTVQQGTTNTVSNVVLPPTIQLEANAVGVGEDVHVFGEGIPGATTEVFSVATGAGGGASQKKYTTIVASSTTGAAAGEWQLTIPGREFSRGTFTVQARAVVSNQLQSPLSIPVYLGVGESPSSDLGLRADINKDGRVNLVDFSIMLSFWNTGDPDADINQDGIVNLADFSVMLFYWTG